MYINLTLIWICGGFRNNYKIGIKIKTLNTSMVSIFQRILKYSEL